MPSASRRHFRRRIASFWVLGGLLVGLLFILDRSAPAGRSVIRVGGTTDRANYYAVAHSLIFDRDFDLSNQYAALGVAGEGIAPYRWRWKEVQPQTGLPGTPFPIGFSLLQVPFILGGTLLDGFLHDRWDGYSRLPAAGFFIGNLFYLCAGLTLLYLLLRRAGTDLGHDIERSEWTAWIVALGMWPTTSLAYYSFGPMSHLAAFAASCAFLLAWWRARDDLSWRSWLIVGASGGLLFLCRWQMALFGLIPALYDLARLGAGELQVRGPQGRPWILSRLAGVGGALLLGSPQLAQWKAIYGSYLTVPQGGDFFELPPRHALHVLVSTNHGWFVWTPITLVGVVGLLLWCARRPRLFLPLAVALAAQVLVIGSLRISWMASESFSIRTLTESLPLVGLGLMLLLLDGSVRARVFLYATATACAAWSLVFAVQYRLDALPKNDRLTPQELVLDKLRLERTVKRCSASLEVQRLLEENPERALALATAATARFGQDRFLLKLMADAHRRRGRLDAAAEAERRLESLLERRLF